MRIAIYARVSTKDQKCEIQLKELRKYAVAREWTVIDEYVDTGWSGAKASRPAMDRLMIDARARKFDTVIVYKLDRWGRSVINLVNSMAELTLFGVRFLVTTQPIDTDENNPAAKLLMNILAAVAQFEREIIHERVMSGLKHVAETGKTKSGKAVGRPVKIVDRQAVWDKFDNGATYTELQATFGYSRGTLQRIVRMRPQAQSKMSA